MREYLASLHNNLNKGIKGCRGSRVHRTTMPSSPDSTPPSSPTSVVSYNSPQYEVMAPYTGHMQPFPQMASMNHHATSYYGYSNPAAYSLGPQHIAAQDGIHVDIRMCDTDNDSTCGSSMASPTSTATYDDEHEQRVVFGHRIY